jgi:signal transduction histidine kinase
VARDFGRGRLDARANMNRSDELGEMARAFDDMADRIAHLLRTERELLANVSHELRTPLARIRVALDLANEVEEGGDPRQAALSLQEIAEDLAELERLVDDVLAAARLALDEGTNAGIPIRREPLDPRSLLEKSVAKFTAAHPRRELRVRIDDDLPPMLGDVVLLRRVVDNLLDNAQKYSDKESEPVWLDAHCAIDDGRDGREDRHDEGRASGTRKSLVIEVRDRGIGIALTDLSRLFEPFFRADRSRTRSTGGLGLGLALARRVVDAHGGTIAFTSEVGKGTTARVTLPLDA